MSLAMMKKRMSVSGMTAREEMIRDGQNLLREELEHDVSFSDTMYKYSYTDENGIVNHDGGKVGELANLRIYKQTKYGQKFTTTIDNPVQIGDYFYNSDDDSYWIVHTAKKVDNIHYEGAMYRCNYNLTWLSKNKDRIIQRWGYVEDFTKYDSGKIANGVIAIGSNQYGVTFGVDRDTMELTRGHRFVIDFTTREDDPNTYVLSNEKPVLFSYKKNGEYYGVVTYTLVFDAYNKNTDKRIKVNDEYYWICDYEEDKLPIIQEDNIVQTNVSSLINGSDTINCGRARSWTVEFSKEEQVLDLSDVDFAWSWDIEPILDATIPTYDSTSIEITKTEDLKITLKVSDKGFIGQKFKLGIMIDGNMIIQKVIEIRGGM